MIIDQLPLLPDPNSNDEIPIERGTSLYKTKVRTLMALNPIEIDLDAEIQKAVFQWLETHTISGVMFTVSGKNLTLTSLD